MRLLALSLFTLSLALGCDGETAGDDAGPDDRTDAGPPMDGGADPMDAGSDAGVPGDDGGPPPGDAGSCGDDGTDDVIEGAAHLGDIQDNESFPAGSVDVTIFDVTDRDWFTYTVTDGRFANVQPRADLTGLPGGPRYELCVYYECDTALNGVGCELGNPHELTTDRHGCCAIGNGTELSVKLSPSCDTTSESGTVFVRVAQQGGAATCDPFTLDWGDD